MIRRSGASPRTRSTLTRLTVPLAVVLGCSQAPDGSETLDAAEETLAPAADVMGFETTADWTPQSGQKASSTDRTRGQRSLALSGLSGYVPITSSKLASSSPELAGLGEGSRVSVDVKLPTNQENPWWHGAMQMFLSVPSLNLYNVYLGQRELTPEPKGKYLTFHYSVPGYAGQLLEGASYNDLTFTIVLNVPQGSPGTYRLDNLRLRDAFPTGGAEEAQAGEHVLLRAWKGNGGEPSHVDDLTFAPGVVQIPARLHVAEGNAGSGTARLHYAAPGAALSQCTYAAEAGSAGAYYALGSCQSGAVAGDLVPASRLKLEVVAGSGSGPRTKIRAQIAKNPLGDELGNIAPIPTYFGSSAAETETILKAYSEAQRSWPVTPGAKLIRVPTPDFQFQASVVNNDSENLPTPPPDSLDPPFRQDGRLTGTDIIDAKWIVSGLLDIQRPDPRTRRSVIESSLDIRGVLFGGETSLAYFSAGASATATNNPDGSSAFGGQATFCTEYLGVDEDCETFSADGGFPRTLLADRSDVQLFNYTWWIFTLRGDIGLDVELAADLDFHPAGLSVGFTPSAGASVEISGGLAVGGFLGGGVSGSIDLIAVDVPAQMTVTAPVDTAPRVCAILPHMSFSMEANVSAGGGAFKYYYEGGVSCGFWDDLCWREEGEIYSWRGHELDSYTIVPSTPIADLPPIPWLSEDCSSDLTLTVYDPTDGETRRTEETLWVNFDAFRGGSNGIIEEVDCADPDVACTVTSSDPGDVIDPATVNNNSQRLTLSATPGEHHISVLVTDDIGSSGVVTRTILVETPPPGSPPIPIVDVSRHVIDCRFPDPAILTGSFVYPAPGDPANVILVWFRGAEEILRGENTLVVNSAPRGGQTYWLVAFDTTNGLQSAIPVVISSQCVG